MDTVLKPFGKTVFGLYSYPEVANFVRNNIQVKIFEVPKDGCYLYFAIFEFLETHSVYFTCVTFHSIRTAIDTMEKWIDNYDYDPFLKSEV